MIGGGFTSRTIFVYADTKAQYVAYPGLRVPTNLEQQADALVSDLEDISQNLVGEYKLSPGAVAFGEQWYKDHFAKRPANLDDDRFGGYIARKQTHVHKLAMIMAASQSNTLVITEEHLAVAHTMVTDLEQDMQFVFSKIGRSDSSLYAERLVGFVHSKGQVPYSEAYRYVHSYFPSMRDFEDVLLGCIRAGYVVLMPGASPMLKAGPNKVAMATQGKS